MATKQFMLTLEGKNQLEEELDFLKGEKRKEIAEKIKVARSYGDLSENSEYDDAKNEQAILEARIVTIESTLKNAVLIKENETNQSIIHVGSTIKVEYLAQNKQVTYRIVGSNETDPSAGRISDESPIGAALIGHQPGDVIEVEVPNGSVAIKVLEIL
ncbi:MAG: transcription elongation factor GreA [Oscillospiraceae bacterium]|jgi:transcription elongation factor GreA|nr:transcription elongation factor GreA [Oscillospiraceae bacterium]